MSAEKIKLLALDLDGTVLTDENTLAPAVKRSIETAVKSGIEVVAASGRPYGSMPKSVLEIEGLNYSITSNGAAVYDRSGKRIYASLLKEDDVLKLLETTQEYDIIFEAFINGLTYTDRRYVENPEKYGCSKAYIDYVRASHGHVDDMKSFIFNHRAELDSVQYVCTDRAKREAVRERIAKNISGFFITSSSENFVEFMDRNATKGNAVKRLCADLGIPLSQTAACGNADNDADMIKQAGFGAAVKNASKMCLECADAVVPSNNDGGVAQLVEIILSAKNKLR